MNLFIFAKKLTKTSLREMGHIENEVVWIFLSNVTIISSVVRSTTKDVNTPIAKEAKLVC